MRRIDQADLEVRGRARDVRWRKKRW